MRQKLWVAEIGVLVNNRPLPAPAESVSTKFVKTGDKPRKLLGLAGG